MLQQAARYISNLLFSSHINAYVKKKKKGSCWADSFLIFFFLYYCVHSRVSSQQEHQINLHNCKVCNRNISSAARTVCATRDHTSAGLGKSQILLSGVAQCTLCLMTADLCGQEGKHEVAEPWGSCLGDQGEEFTPLLSYGIRFSHSQIFPVSDYCFNFEFTSYCFLMARFRPLFTLRCSS